MQDKTPKADKIGAGEPAEVVQGSNVLLEGQHFVKTVKDLDHPN